MATTSNTYTGNGSNKLFSITFPYLETSDIDVYLNGTLQTIITQYTFANATTVEFVTAPANGAEVIVDRSTDDSAPNATFLPGSSIKASDLNDNFDQVLFIAQETANSAANQSTAGLQAQITTATNTANTAIGTANTANATANGISATANTALTNSNTAVSTANTANATANTAITTANAISTTANTALTTANTAVTTANTATTTANTAQTTANAALPKAGGTMTGLITFDTSQPRIVIGTAVNSTSGVSVDFTGLPTWVKRITLMLKGVSTTGTSPPIIQLGDSGGYEITGYDAAAGSSGGNTTFTTGFSLSHSHSASDVFYGAYIISSFGSNSWALSGSATTSNVRYAAGTKTLSATLDRIRLTTVLGSDTFDAGSINILYEG